jgi:PIN domain nuclease of toxin-antitoxin system
MIYVMDASALIAYVRNEPGGQDVEDLLLDSTNTCYVHAINLCEVYYDHLKVALRGSISLAAAITTASAEIADLQNAGLIGRDDIDEAFWMEAGGYKAQFQNASIADCFLVTLARRISGQIVTADRGNFQAIESAGFCSALFIR